MKPSIITGTGALTMAALAAGLGFIPEARGADKLWSGGTGSYANAAAWGGTLPGSADNAINDSGVGNVVQINAGDPNWTVLDIRGGNGDGTAGAFEQNGATLTITGWWRLGIGVGATGVYTLNNGTLVVNGGRIRVGENGAGLFNIHGGTITKSGDVFAVSDSAAGGSGIVNQDGGVINSTSELWVGQFQGVGTYNFSGGTINLGNWLATGRGGGNGTFNMTGGTLNKNAGGNFIIADGSGSLGTFNHSAGTINCATEYWLGNSGGSFGTNNISGTASVTVNNWVAIGRNGTGVLNLSGGSFTKTGVSGGNVVIPGINGLGIVNQTGGTFTNTATQTWLPETGTGEWDQSGGFTTLGVLHICQNANAVGTYNLLGGTLRATEITTGNTTGFSTLNLDGGTLQAGADNPNFLHDLSQAFIGNGGVTIDSLGFNVTIAQGLFNNGTGGVTKLGAGTVKLLGPNSYSGPTVINAGKLYSSTQASGGGDYTVANGAGLGVATVFANSQLSVPNVTLATSTTATLDFDLDSFGNPSVAPLNVTGTLAVNGIVTVNIADGLPQVGQFPLLQYATRTGTGGFVLGTLPPGVTAHLVTNTPNSSLDLVIDSAGTPRWDGSVSGVWDINTTANWVDLGTLLPSTYHEGNPVLFDDNATGTTDVSLNANVHPGGFTVNNNALNYTIEGSGRISGAVSLLKLGAGTLSILNSGLNDYTGPTLIGGGVLSVTNLANGGLPSAIGASSGSYSNLVLSNATFQYSGPPVSVDRGYAIAYTNNAIDAQSDLTLRGVVAALPGSSSFKTGPARLTYAASGVNELSGGLNPGFHVAAGTVVFDGTGGSQTNHTQQELWVGANTNVGASLVLSNTVLRVDSWIGVGRANGTVGNTSSVALYNSTFQMGNASFGYDNGLPGNFSYQTLSLNGNSVFTNRGDANFAESTGSHLTVNINGNSMLWSANRLFLGQSANTEGNMTIADSGQLVINTGGWFSIANNDGSTGSLIVKDNGSISVALDLNVTDVGAGTASMVARDNSVVGVNNLYVGKGVNSVGSLLITNNARVVSSNGLTMASSAGATATVDLAGGSLQVNLVQGGAGAGTFNFNGGRLIAHQPISADFMFNLAAINVKSGGAVIDSDTYTISITQPLLDAGGGGGLTKLGAGTLYLNGANTYTGPTLVAAGSLGGNGTILGPVTVLGGASLTPGVGIGALTINNALTLQGGSTTFAEVSVDGGVTNNDLVTGLTSVTYSGSLVVTNVGTTPLAVGNVFKLFNSAAGGIGNFSSVTILPAGSGTFNPATGELTITSTGGGPVIGSVAASGGNLILTGTGGTAGSGYTWLTTTNTALPLANWTTNSTGTFSSGGTFSNAISINPAEPSRFYRLRVP